MSPHQAGMEAWRGSLCSLGGRGPWALGARTSERPRMGARGFVQEVCGPPRETPSCILVQE